MLALLSGTEGHDVDVNSHGWEKLAHLRWERY